MKVFILLACLVAVQASGVYEQYRPQPYKFGYVIKDKGSVQSREEESNGAGVVQGSYSIMDNKGINRQVNYVADKGGFRAKIRTNEPGTANQSPAAVKLISNDPYAQGAAVPYISRPNVPYVPALYTSDPVYGFPTQYKFNPNAVEYLKEDYGRGYGRPSYNNMMGSRYGPGGNVYFGANEKGGEIVGYNSGFLQLYD